MKICHLSLSVSLSFFCTLWIIISSIGPGWVREKDILALFCRGGCLLPSPPPPLLVRTPLIHTFLCTKGIPALFFQSLLLGHRCCFYKKPRFVLEKIFYFLDKNKALHASHMDCSPFQLYHIHTDKKYISTHTHTINNKTHKLSFLFQLNIQTMNLEKATNCAVTEDCNPAHWNSFLSFLTMLMLLCPAVNVSSQPLSWPQPPLLPLLTSPRQ